MASHRMHRGLVAISASAVAAIYMAGFLRTQAADAGIAADTAPSVALASPTVVSAAPPPQAVAPAITITSPRSPTPTRVIVAPVERARPTATTAPVAAQTAGAYKDGTYTGQGTSRRGDVWVSLQIQGGQITNVTITRSTLQYPLRDIANLPSQVVQRQSPQVDTVSRATYSSMAFKGAVAQALASAKA